MERASSVRLYPELQKSIIADPLICPTWCLHTALGQNRIGIPRYRILLISACMGGDYKWYIVETAGDTQELLSPSKVLPSALVYIIFTVTVEMRSANRVCRK